MSATPTPRASSPSWSTACWSRSAVAPRLVDFTWGDPHHPKVTLVGKGVCFDTGGLDLKPASAMGLMKMGTGEFELGGIAGVPGKPAERLMGASKSEVDFALDPG